MYLNNFLYSTKLLVFSILVIVFSDTFLNGMEKPESENILSLTYGAASSIGGPKRRHKLMEDKHVIALPLDENESDYALFAIFDGHGGPSVSEYSKKNIVHNINIIPGGFTEKLVQGLKNLNQDLKERCSMIPRSGSTAIIALLKDEKLWVANLGNSRAILSRQNEAIALSKDHNAENVNEQERIGKIMVDGHPVMMDKKFIMGVKNKNGISCLALSRGLGDFEFSRFGLSDEAEIMETTFEASDDFLVLASDGIFEKKGKKDEFSIQEVVEFVAESLRSNDNDPALAAQDLIDQAIYNGSSDNLTAIIILPENRQKNNPICYLTNPVIMNTIHNKTNYNLLLIAECAGNNFDLMPLPRHKLFEDIDIRLFKKSDGEYQSIAIYFIRRFEGYDIEEMSRLLKEIDVEDLISIEDTKLLSYKPNGNDNLISYKIKTNDNDEIIGIATKID